MDKDRKKLDKNEEGNKMQSAIPINMFDFQEAYFSSDIENTKKQYDNLPYPEKIRYLESRIKDIEPLLEFEKFKVAHKRYGDKYNIKYHKEKKPETVTPFEDLEGVKEITDYNIMATAHKTYKKWLEEIKAKSKTNNSRSEPQNLKDIFVTDDVYNEIMISLSKKGFTDKDSGLWTDKTKGYKSKIIALIHHLGFKQYYRKDIPSIPDAETIQNIAKNTFGVEISKDTIKSANREDNNISELRNSHFNFIITYNPK